MNINYKRTSVYENIEYEKPKYMFEYLGNIIERTVKEKDFKSFSLLDVGGASGAFLFYLNHRFSDTIKSSLLEYDKELCEIAQTKIPESLVINGDANNMENISDKSMDIVVCVGVLSIFDDFKPSISEMLRVAKDDATVIVLSQFNNFDIDALIKHKYSDDDTYSNGYNLFSKKSIKNFLQEEKMIEHFKFEKFELPFDLEAQEDPIRTWTEKDKLGQRYLRNGLMPINLETLVIDLGHQ